MQIPWIVILALEDPENNIRFQRAGIVYAEDYNKACERGDPVMDRFFKNLENPSLTLLNWWVTPACILDSEM